MQTDGDFVSRPILSHQNESLDLDAIQARADAASPPPWRGEYVEVFEDNDGVERDGYTLVGLREIDDGEALWFTQADAAFIASARFDVPVLCQALRETQTEIGRLRTAIREYRTAQRAYGEMLSEDSYPSNFADAQTRVRLMRNRLYAAVEASDA